MSSECLILLDAGHGGLDPAGQYTTSPSKEYKHGKGSFHKDGYFYEGVWNRTLVHAVASKLRDLNHPFVLLSHPWLDLSLTYRVEKANWYYKHYPNCALVSSHANASYSHTARGFEVYTTRGKTRSDDLAEIYWGHVESLLGKDITMRSDLSDGDRDKEADYQIIRDTQMPAILIEHLFFDQYEDAVLLFREDVIERFAEAQVRALLDFFAKTP